MLGKKYSIPILKYINSNRWSKASDIANDLSLHVATCTKYLRELHEIGLLDKRKNQGKTREVQEFRLKTPIIKLKFDISECKYSKDSLEIYKKFYNNIYGSTKNVFGKVPFEKDLSDNIINIDRDNSKDQIIKVITQILKYNEKRLGLLPTKKLVRRSCKSLIEKHRKKITNENFLEKIPNKYLDLLLEEL